MRCLRHRASAQRRQADGLNRHDRVPPRRRDRRAIPRPDRRPRRGDRRARGSRRYTGAGGDTRADLGATARPAPHPPDADTDARRSASRGRRRRRRHRRAGGLSARRGGRLQRRIRQVPSRDRRARSLPRPPRRRARLPQAKVANDQNEVMKVLTVIASLLLLPTFIVGLYGQNFQHHFPEIHWRFGYAWSWGLIVVTTAGQLWFFRRKRWI